MKRLCTLFFTMILLVCLACGVQASNGANRFTDWADVRAQAQVAMLTDLHVLSGYGDGSFRPDHSLTRAEIAKVITFLKTDAQPRKAGSAFTDIDDSWAAPYITFCADAGIFSGNGTGAFRPGDNVTGYELTKMLLVTLGYESDLFTGADWRTAVDRAAKTLGLYDGFTDDRDNYISREDACVLISNALQCPVVVGYTADGRAQFALDDMMSPMTLLEHRFGVKLVTGVLQANAAADLRGGAGALAASNLIHIAGYTRDFQVSDSEIAQSTALLGRRVTIYASFGGAYNIAYGLPSVRSTEVYTTFDSVDKLRMVIGSGAAALTAETEYYKNFYPDDVSCLDIMQPGDTVTIIDHENDGKIDIVLVSGSVRQAVW